MGWEAAWMARLDLEKWDRGLYSQAFMERVLAWHSRHNELELHRQDAAARAARRRK